MRHARFLFVAFITALVSGCASPPRMISSSEFKDMPGLVMYRLWYDDSSYTRRGYEEMWVRNLSGKDVCVIPEGNSTGRLVRNGENVFLDIHPQDDYTLLAASASGYSWFCERMKRN